MASNVDCSDSKISAGSEGAFICEDAHNSVPVPVPVEEGKSVTESTHIIIKIALSFRKTRSVPFVGDLDLGAAVWVAMVIPSSFNREGTLSTPF